MQDKTECSYAYLDFMKEGNYFEATRCALAMLEDFAEPVRHHEMMLTISLRRENIAAALEHCEELVSYGKLKGMEVAEYESYRESLLHRLSLTRNYFASRLWDEVQGDMPFAPARYATVPLLLSGEAHCGRNTETGTVFLTFHVRGRTDMRIACRLAPCELPFLENAVFPHWAAVHGRFLSASETLILLDPCHFIAFFDAPVQ